MEYQIFGTNKRNRVNQSLLSVLTIYLTFRYVKTLLKKCEYQNIELNTADYKNKNYLGAVAVNKIQKFWVTI